MKAALDFIASKLTKRNKEEEPHSCLFKELSYEQTIGAVPNPMFYEEPNKNLSNCCNFLLSLDGLTKSSSNSGILHPKLSGGQFGQKRTMELLNNGAFEGDKRNILCLEVTFCLLVFIQRIHAMLDVFLELHNLNSTA
ncbi:uncharacterized protein LOC132031181 [Lycium ferocissimum]|uniref:uncharacterized protein LOC132031181 n=1 Tax=Lycium ferocissimum TaxID=112874 RepID=UPI00281684C3|nr:uncharacterized protein LOC132031181 [Lycium ferocissimum]XP_059277038.1 uncharacterized protein LOC132031181 [Lycium ferocissimum]XP_059277039.1 uncharacterized protein LOC132031181 [Lycium ferocissimum]